MNNTRLAEPPVVLDNRYRFVAILGRGSLGTVYRATDPIRACDVVIKFIDPAQPGQGSGSAGFMHELQVSQQLAHPQIVMLHGLSQDSNWTYLVLELSSGRTLRQILREQGQLSSAEALDLMRRLLTALAYAHAQGVLHRNLKPENLMLAASGRLQIMDLGLGLAAADPRLAGPRSQRTIYTAPELLNLGSATVGSDLYAVGAIWYELLSGQPPLTPVGIDQQDHSVLHARIPELPHEIEHMIMQLLAPNPATRYHSAEAVLRALTHVDLSEHSSPMVTTLAPKQRQHPPRSTDLHQYTASEETIAAVEAERKHMASMLQQQLAEPIHLLLSQANAYEQSLRGQPLAQMAVSVLGTIARQLLQQLRDLEADLHPPALETLGLAPALELLAGQFMRATDVQISLVFERIAERLPMPSELAIFRIIQIALNHAIRVAHATQITLRLERRETQLRLSMRDNGRHDRQRTILLSACQRIEQLGGAYEIGINDGSFELALLFTLVATPLLTAREMEVLQLLAEGISNKQIAHRLMITPRTVNFHLDHIYVKLNVNTRTEASIAALRMGWIKRGEQMP